MNNFSGICSFKESLVVVHDRCQGIQIFNRVDFSLNRVIPPPAIYPRRVCCTPEGLILVTTNECTVLIISQEGNILCQFGSKGEGDGQFQCTEGICCNSRGEFIVSDCVDYRVQIFSKDGLFLRAFNPERHYSPFYQPYGICVDREDNIYVGDYINNRINIFNQEGIAIRRIPFPTPIDLCMMDQRMIVTSDDSIIGIFCN